MEKTKIKLEIGKGKIKDNGYNSTKLWAKRANKASEASMRQVVYESLTAKEKIKLCKNRRGNSKKELARLEKLNK